MLYIQACIFEEIFLSVVTLIKTIPGWCSWIIANASYSPITSRGLLPHPHQGMRAGRSSSETAKGREAPLHGLSPVKTGLNAAFSAPSADQKRAMGTPDYLAPEVLLGEPRHCMAITPPLSARDCALYGRIHCSVYCCCTIEKGTR